MKRLISIVLILLLSCQCLVNMGIVAYYQLNKDYIAEVLCINREKPELQCEGSCFLSEKLQQANQGEENTMPSSTQQQENIQVPVFLISEYRYRFQQVPAAEKERLPLCQTLSLSAFNFSIFHPPRA